FYIFLIAAGLLIAAFLYVALSTRNAREINMQSAYGLRKLLFFVVLAVLVLGIGMTLGKTPYPKANELPGKVVFVVGKQFSFSLRDTPHKDGQGLRGSPLRLSRAAPRRFVDGIPRYELRRQSQLRRVLPG